jgi:hypothetical protein
MKNKEKTVDSQQKPWTQPLLTKHEQLHALTGKSAENGTGGDSHDNGNHYGHDKGHGNGHGHGHD